MVYTSDLRGKHILRDLQSEILSDLRALELDDKIFLRVFDDSQEDDALWENGGLAFKDPDTGLTLGSNDAAWYVVEKGKPTPLVVVESTFGTERGQFGDGQFNRFSHPLAPSKLGHIAIMLIPFKGESYAKSGGVSGYDNEFASMKHAHLNKTIVLAALGICEKEKGQYLLVDFYDLDTLKQLIEETLKKKLGLDNQQNIILQKIRNNMKKYAGISKASYSIIKTLRDKNGKPLQNSFGVVFTQNYPALTTSTKRDAHGLLGKTMSLYYLHPNKKMYSIFLRLDKSKIVDLKKRRGKEITYIFNNPNSVVIPRDDLIFEDQNLRKKLVDIENINLFQNRQKELLSQVIEGLKSGSIRINK